MNGGVIIFGGTSEGRKIAQYLSRNGAAATICVASEYGSGVLPEMEGITVNEGKLDTDAIASMIDETSLVIDATHPYAAAVTSNVKTACQQKNAHYYRLFRPEVASGDLQAFETYQDVINYLNSTTGNILLTTGSRALDEFTKVRGFDERIFARILPDAESLTRALELGYKASNIICMQGPFSEQMNAAMIQSKQIKYLVTKDSGAPGGTDEKISAAISNGAEALVVGRPLDEKGYKYSEIIDILNRHFDIEPTRDRHYRFPLFIDLNGKCAVVFGGGTIAQRRVSTLLKFGAKVKIVSPKLTPQLARIAKSEQVIHKARKFSPADLEGAAIVLAATNDREANHKIAELAAAKSIPVSVADCREECSFFFPAVAFGEDIVAGLVSVGEDHKQTVQTAAKIRDLLSTI